MTDIIKSKFDSKVILLADRERIEHLVKNVKAKVLRSSYKGDLMIIPILTDNKAAIKFNYHIPIKHLNKIDSELLGSLMLNQTN